MVRRIRLVAASIILVAMSPGQPATAQTPSEDLPPIVGSWQIAALTADGFEFWIQYTFTSDGIVWVFVPDGRHGSGHWEESADGEVTMSFVIQSGTEAVPSVERIWERFPMPEPGADTWASEFSYYTEDIEGDIIEGGPAGSVVARRFDVRADLDGEPVAAAPAQSPDPTAVSTAASPAADQSPSTVLTITTPAAAPGTFDTATLSAPAGTEVSVAYDNQSPHLHNIAFFEGDSIDDPLIARTEIAGGPGVQEVTFDTPDEPGSYLYVCEIHPIAMTGFLVTS
jgi:plastocyanin